MDMNNLKDANNNIHNKCPRCSGNWKALGPEHTYCNNCGMMACLEDNGIEYFLSVDILDTGRNTSYAAYWYNSGCMVTVTKNGEEHEECAHIPLLPFDVTYNKLQTYLIFS